MYHRSGPRRIKSESAEGTNRLITCEVDGGANCWLLSNQHLETGRLAADRCGNFGGAWLTKVNQGGGGVGVRKVGLSGSPLFSPHSERLSGSLFIPAAARWPTI